MRQTVILLIVATLCAIALQLIDRAPPPPAHLAAGAPPPAAA